MSAKDLRPMTMRDTADIRARILQVWKMVEERKISPAEARLQMALARTVLETLKVEIAAAHLAQQQLSSVPLTSASVLWPRPITTIEAKLQAKRQ